MKFVRRLRRRTVFRSHWRAKKKEGLVLVVRIINRTALSSYSKVDPRSMNNNSASDCEAKVLVSPRNTLFGAQQQIGGAARSAEQVSSDYAHGTFRRACSDKYIVFQKR
jgi:hypothetical protein